MKSRIYYPLVVLTILPMLLAACQAGGSELDSAPPLAGQQISEAAQSGELTANSAESDGFMAEATSSISVLLSWSAVEGAAQYQIEASVVGDDYVPLADFGPDVTSAEVLPIPDTLEISYRLTAVLSNGQSEVREVKLAIPEEIPNSYTVELTLEQTEVGLPGFDLSSFDPSTFDASQFDSETFDPSSLIPGPATVSQEIGPEGGFVEVTSSTGVSYNLTVPEGALPFPLDISLTPIVSIDNLPDEVEILAAVQIEPDGIPLAAPATLTISWPDPISESEGSMFVGVGFENSGQDFHFLPLDPGTSVADLFDNRGSLKVAEPIMRPAAYGAGGYSMTQLQSQAVAKVPPGALIKFGKNNPPADQSRSTSQEAAVKEAGTQSSNYANDILTPLVEPPFESWLSENIQNRAASGSSQELFESLSDFEFLLKQFGDKLPDEEKDKAWDVILNSVHTKLKEAADAPCLSDEHMYGIQLAERLAKPASPFNRELLNRFITKYGSEGQDLIRKAMELADRCPLYLWVESDITYTNLDGDVTVHTKITADITLTWKFDRKGRQPYLIGEGPIEYQANTMLVDSCEAEPDTKAGSRFLVQKLSPQFENQLLTDFRLERYRATGQMKKYIILTAPPDSGCVKGPQPGVIPHGDQWWTDYGAYMIVKGFQIKDWVIRANAGMSTIADKTIVHAGSTIDLGDLDGTTKFILVNEDPK